MPTFTLTPDERDQIHAALAGLTGQERQRARLRSRLLRLRPEFRQMDNERNAAQGRARHHADIEAERRKGLEKWRRRAGRERAKRLT